MSIAVVAEPPWTKARGYCPGCLCERMSVRRVLTHAVEHICTHGHNWFHKGINLMHVHNVHPANLPAELEP